MLMAVLTVVLMGAVAHSFLNVDRLPPLSFPVITVSVAYPQAAAQDVEQLVTEPIENALSGVEGVDTISSTSREGGAVIRVQLVQGADPDLAALDVERRVSRILSKLPHDITAPSIQKADPNETPVMNIAFTGAPLDDLLDAATNQIVPTLESVLGVASVNVTGGLQREIQVHVDYAKLAAYNLSVQQLSDALTAANLTSTVGTVEDDLQRQDIRAVGAFQSPADIANLVVSQQAGGPVLVRDVATVEEGHKIQTQLQRINGQDAVGLSIVKSSTANALQVADGIQDAIKRLQSTLPPNTQIYVTNDTSKYTRTALDAVQSDLVLAVILVAIVVLLFLHAWRNALIIVLAIPTSMISTFLVMFALGFSLNLMTLMALALTVGILVDDSTVVIENIHRHLQLGESPQEAALRGRNEIGLAATAITAADIVVYTPIAFMSGLVGQLFRQYGLTIVAATIFSYLVSFTLTPMLASRWLKHEEHRRGPMVAFGRWWDRSFDRLGMVVERAVPLAVRSRWLVVLFGLGLIGASAFLIQFRMVGTEYAPGEDTDSFTVNLQMPSSASLAATDNATRQVEAALQAMPEVQYIFTSVSVGSSGGGFGNSTGGIGRINVQLVPKRERTRSVFDVAQAVRQLGRQIPDARVTASVPSSFPGGGGSGGLNFDVNGPDVDVLNQLVAQLEAAAATVPGLTDIQDTGSQGTPEVQIIFDSARMAQLGVTTQQATTALRTTLGGAVVTELRKPGAVQEDITVIAGDVQRNDLTRLASIPIKAASSSGSATSSSGAGGSATGSTPANVVTLGQVATIRPGTGPVQIDRLNRNRNIDVSGTAVGRPLGDVAADLQTVLNEAPIPAGYTVTPGRQINQFTTALAALLQALAFALVLEYMLLAALYESWFYPLVLILSVPLGLVGSIAALWVTGNTVNIFSLMGLIMAFGLVAKNGILLVDYTNQLRREGRERTEALALAARTRLRPILMTSATMLFGMLPLAFKTESGAESRAPMAVVVIGAILTSTILAVVVLPAVYTLFDDLQSLLARKPAPAKVVPATVSAMPAGLPVSRSASDIRQPNGRRLGWRFWEEAD